MKATRIDVVPNGYVEVGELQSTLYWFDQTYRVPTPIHVGIANDKGLEKIVAWIDSSVPICSEELQTWGSGDPVIVSPFTTFPEYHSPRPLPLKCKTSPLGSEEGFVEAWDRGDMDWQTTVKNSLIELTNNTNCVWNFLVLPPQEQESILQDWFFDLENISVALNQHEHGYLVVGEQRVVERFVDDDPYYTVVMLRKGQES